MLMDFVTEKIVSENAFVWRYDSNSIINAFSKFEHATITTRLYGDNVLACTFANIDDQYLSVASKPYHCLCNAGRYIVWASDDNDDMAKYSIFRTMVEQCSTHIKDLRNAIEVYYDKMNRAKDILDVEHIDLSKSHQA